MTRLEAITHVVQAAGHHPILANLGTNTYDLFAAGDRPENFYMWGAMGSVSSIGLGLALAQPSLRVIVLDGDGSLLMNLGSLATIAAVAPPNLVHIVFDNRMYETTGGQASHTARGANLVEIGRGAGIKQAQHVETLEAFAEATARAMKEDGPWLIAARVGPSSYSASAPRRPIYYKYRFMTALGTIERSR
jgi:thiamine pyrophosphate-dependent acetolactate synthase large subunit-like protein